MARLSVSSEGLRRPSGVPRFPWTRSEAFRFWMMGVATTALLETALVALGAAFPAAASARGGAGESTLRVLAIAAALPLLFLVLGRFAEGRYQRRPPKAFQAWQFGLYLAGTALVSAGFLRHQANLAPSRPLFAAGEVLLGTATVLLAAWLVSVVLCTPPEDAPLTTP